MLERALDIFLERGFEQATTGDIAAAVGMSKRTLYSLYKDKPALFVAAVERAADRYTVPYETFTAIKGNDLEAILIEVARIRIANVVTPNGIKFQRILSTQFYRFPDLFTRVAEQATQGSFDYLSELFLRWHDQGVIAVSEPKRMAIAFLSLVVGVPTRIILSGSHLSAAEIEEHIAFAVDLFLNGIRQPK